MLIKDPQPFAQHFKDGWTMGQIIWCEGGAGDNRVGPLFQVADVDDDALPWVNANPVTHVLHALDGSVMNSELSASFGCKQKGISILGLHAP